jgi:uncharacterized membrane protein YgdD (TMEM256/DUF423 family)
MDRLSWLACGGFGFTSVALGAFGAHGLKAKLGPLADGAQRLEWWNTGAHYQVVHALALGLVAVLASRTSSSSPTSCQLSLARGRCCRGWGCACCALAERTVARWSSNGSQRCCMQARLGLR